LAAITSVGRASGLDSLEVPDESGTATLYERHSGSVFGYCLSRLGRREDAEDAVQTTFLQAFRSLRRGVVPLVESAWLIGIARNVCRARWEAAGRELRLESACDPVELDQGNAAPEGRRDELIGLQEALAQLPEQQRDAVLLRDWRGLSYDEVAEQLGVSHAAVETLIFRGRRTLAELLGEEPRTTRRRLAALGNLGSLVTAVKTAFSGAAAATKVAAALSVTALAVGGAGVAITSPSPGTSSSPGASSPGISASPGASEPSAGRAGATQTQTPASAPVPAHTSPAPAAAASPRPERPLSVPAGDAPPTPTAGAPVQGAASPAPQPAAEAPATTPKLEATAPATPVLNVPKANDPAPPVTTPVEGVVGGVTETVTAVAEPLTTPATELVTDTIAALPPVLPPVTVTPPPVPAPAPPVAPVKLP
jgi:RNA polymerase sigma-70 factor (ECF subfamily)